MPSPANNWSRVPFPRCPDIPSDCAGLRICPLPLEVPQEQLHGKRLLFLSDFHIRAEKTIAVPGPRPWRGLDLLREAFPGLLRELRPDFLVFGGDLVTDADYLAETLCFLKQEMPPSLPSIAIPGNWDAPRRKFLPYPRWKKGYADAGFTYLRNQVLDLPGIRFVALDDFKCGTPALSRFPEHDPRHFLCLLAHNPDAIPRTIHSRWLDRTDLILCGHTHGGQVRIPPFGALLTSSIYGKRFERGLFQRPRPDGKYTRLFVSSGIGATWIPVRIFSPPEATLVLFLPPGPTP